MWTNVGEQIASLVFFVFVSRGAFLSALQFVTKPMVNRQQQEQQITQHNNNTIERKKKTSNAKTETNAQTITQ